MPDSSLNNSGNPSPNGPNGDGRDSQGRFAKGNPGGPGNPNAKKVAELRTTLLGAVSAADLRAIEIAGDVLKGGRSSDLTAYNVPPGTRLKTRGFDGVLVSGCHPGDCHYAKGNYYARRRIALTQDLLRMLGIPPERFHFEVLDIGAG